MDSNLTMSFLTQSLWKKNKFYRSNSLFPWRCEDGLDFKCTIFCEETENIVYILPGNATVIMIGTSIDILVTVTVWHLSFSFPVLFQFGFFFFFSGSISLLNFMFISWIVLIISLHCLGFMVLVKASIHILFNITCYFEVPVLCLS